MVTVIDFLTELGNSIIELGGIFVTDIALGDPLAFISFLTGTIVMAVSLGVFGYLVLGALGREIGLNDPAPGHDPYETPPRH